MFTSLGGYVRRHHIALLALFVSLGGTSYAALKLPKNSVGAKQIKRHAVTRAKLAKGAVGSAQVGRGSLTGANINLSKLGTVPDAAHAGSADTLAGQPPSSFLPSGSIQRFDFNTVAGLGQGRTSTLLSSDGFTVQGQCQSNGGIPPIVEAKVNITAAPSDGEANASDVDMTNASHYISLSGTGNLIDSHAAPFPANATPAGNNGVAVLRSSSHTITISYHTFAAVNGSKCEFQGNVVIS